MRSKRNRFLGLLLLVTVLFWWLFGSDLPVSSSRAGPPAPVPEPGSLILLGTGVAGLVFAKWKNWF